MVGSPNLSGHLRHSCVWQLGRGPWGGGLKKKIILWKLIKGGESAIFSSQNHDHDQFTESWSFVAKTRHFWISKKVFGSIPKSQASLPDPGVGPRQLPWGDVCCYPVRLAVNIYIYQIPLQRFEIGRSWGGWLYIWSNIIYIHTCIIYIYTYVHAGYCKMDIEMMVVEKGTPFNYGYFGYYVQFFNCNKKMHTSIPGQQLSP